MAIYHCQIVGTGRYGDMGAISARSFKEAAKKAVKRRYIDGDNTPSEYGPTVEVTKGDETKSFCFKDEFSPSL